MSYDFNYTGAVQTQSLPAGKYKIECWGAQGGHVNASYPGGKGGYSAGVITLRTTTTVYVYVGQTGQKGATFNIGHSKAYTNTKAKNGGGATDVRIGTDSLYYRVIVAGGGGGASYYSSSSYGLGGVGGGANGGDGTSRPSEPNEYGRGGTQIAGGANGRRTHTSMLKASFGVGGWPQGANYSDASGGGGWYGGGCGGRPSSDYCEAGGGGGSGWVYTLQNFAVWNAGNPTDAANWRLTTASCLSDAETHAGNETFPSPTGGTETGHSGNGFARITEIPDNPPDIISIDIDPNPVTTSSTFIISVRVTDDEEIQTWNVAYNAEGGTSSKSSETVERGSSVVLPNATRSGFSFNGWYTAASGGTRVGGAGGSYTPSADTTLHAQWSASSVYTVTYNANGGTCDTASESVNPGSSVVLPNATKSQTTSKTYTFAGWYTAASGGTRIGGAGGSYTPSGNITLYAQWTETTRQYTVKFYKYDGNATWSLSSTQTVNYNTTVSCSPYAGKLIDTQYYDYGWYTTKTTSTRTATLTGSVTVTSDLTLYECYKGKSTTLREIDIAAGADASGLVQASFSKRAKIRFTVSLLFSTAHQKTVDWYEFIAAGSTLSDQISDENVSLGSYSSINLYSSPDATLSSGNVVLSYDFENFSESVSVLFKLVTVTNP